MTYNHKASLLDINLNVELTYPETSSNIEDAQQQNVREIHHMPDLNISAAENFAIDLNTTPNFPATSSPDQFLFDLNMPPYDTSLSENIRIDILEIESELREENIFIFKKKSSTSSQKNSLIFHRVSKG